MKIYSPWSSLLKILFSVVLTSTTFTLRAQSPTITSFTPSSGPIGSAVVISGSNFSTTTANNIVWFGAVKAPITAATTTTISVTVPAGATYQPITVTVNGLTAYSISPFIVTFLGNQIIDATSFSPIVTFTTGTNPYSVAIGDIDGDGKPDLVVANTNSNNFSVYRNISTSGTITAASFDAKVDFTTGGGPKGITIGDIDGDGKKDIIVANYFSNSISVFRNISTSGSISSGSFETKVDFPTGDNPFDIAVGDIDGDGKPDLAVTNYVGNLVSVFRNTSTSGSINTGSFASKVDFATGINPQGVAIADMDEDGKPDLVINNFNSHTFSVFRNISTSETITTGSFESRMDFPTGISPYGFAIGDIDGDNKPDIVVNNINNNFISIFRNISTSGSITAGSFAARVDFQTSITPYDLAIGDIDGDGKPDLAVTNYNSNTINILKNISTPGSITSGSLSPKVDFFCGINPWGLAIGDIDGDGKSDMVVANYLSNNISVLRNTIALPAPPVINSFSPTSGPVGISVIITGSNFSSNPTENIVWFGAVKATVTAATSTSLSVTVPTSATHQPINVTNVTNGLGAFSDKPFYITFPSTHLIDISAFGSKVDFTSGTAPWSSAISDIDGDGKPDIVVVNNNSNTVSVYRNTSSADFITAGSFANRVDFTTGINPNQVVIGDIDGDGKQDLVVINQNSNSISVFRNTSTPGSITAGSFATKVDFITGDSPYFIAIGDIDGDGKPDLAVTNWGSNTVSVLRNTSTSGSVNSGSFATKVDFIVGNYPSGVAIGDIDGDGKPDLVVNNFNGNLVSVFRNTSITGSIDAGSFIAKVDFITGSAPLGVALGDFNRDGKPDLAVVNNHSNTVSIFRNTGNLGSITTGSFETRVDYITESNPYMVTTGDIDGDSIPDLAISNSGSNTISVLRNTSISGFPATVTFATKVDYTVGSNPIGIDICDLDGDGKADLIAVNSYDNTISVLRNTLSEEIPPVINSFSPTSGPIGTAVIISGSNFSTTASENIVWFGAVKASVTAASSTLLTVTVPAGATYQPITVTVNGLTAYSTIPFNVTFPGTHIIDSTSFTPAVNFLTGTNPWAGIAIGDLDGDSKPDMVVTNFGSNNISVYRNISSPGYIGGASFASKVDFVTAAGPYSVAIGDIDGDGKPDLVVTNSNSNSISIFRNTSTPGSITISSFADKIDIPTTGGPWGVAVGDIDRDGKPDIIVTNANGNSISVFRNISVTGSITLSSFAPKVDFPAGTWPSGVAIGDLDGDGKPDLAVTNMNSRTISIFRNISTRGSISTGSLSAKVDLTISNYLIPGISIGIAIVDIDGDSKPDLAITNQDNSSISVFRNISTSGLINSASFADKIDFSSGTSPQYIAAGDIDGDGKPDLAVTNNGAGTISVLRNISISGSITSGSFAPKIDFPTKPDLFCVTIGDLDGDGKPDFVVGNFSSNTVSVLRNKISEPDPPVISSFVPTSGPIGTTVTISGSNFSTTTSNNIVWFGAVQATVTAASSTILTATVPMGTSYQPITVTVNGLTAYSAKPFNVTLPGINFIDGTAFAPKIDLDSGTNPWSVAIGDIDADGKPDLVVSNSGSNTISVYRNISTSGSVSAGSFTSRIDFFTGFNPWGIAIADIDGDGKLDIVVANNGSNNVSVFRNTSSRGSITSDSFAPRVDFTTPNSPQFVACSDLDGDGKPELVATGGNVVSVLRNTSTSGSVTSNSFSAKVDFATGSNPVGVSIGDLDGDGKPDLVVANFQSNTVSVLRNTSTPGFIVSDSFAPRIDLATGTNPWYVAIGDIDGDGKQDLAVTNYSSSTVSVLRNLTTSGSINAGSFAPNVDFMTGSAPYYIAISDLDGDGKPDLSVANGSSQSISVLRNISSSGNISTGSFAGRVDFSTGNGPQGVAIGDIDGDGKPDIVFTNRVNNTISVIRNTIHEVPTSIPPVISSINPISGPIGTAVNISGSNFSTTASNNIVWFGAVKATVSAASSTTLTVAAPTGATYQPITVTVNGLTAYSSVPFNVTFPSSQIIDTSTFSSRVDLTSGANPNDIAIGDIDGDGKPDLVVTNATNNTISIFRNISSSGSITAGSFASKVDLNTGGFPQCITIEDIDGDGKPDLIVANYYSSTVSVFRNASSLGSISEGSFDPRVDFTTGTNPRNVAVGDIDGDGKPDLIVTNNFSNSISILRNREYAGSITTNSFAAKVDFPTGASPMGVVIGDIDGDSKPDIGVVNNGSNTLSIYRNTSSMGSIDAGSFAPRIDFSTGSTPVDIEIGDIDGDNKPDLVVTNNGSSTFSVFRNAGITGSISAGSFNPRVDFITGEYPGKFAIGDIDGDGKPDLVSERGGNSVSVFRNTSTSGSITPGSFASRVDFTSGASPNGVIICDIDGDGKPDFAAANYNSISVSVFRNKIPDSLPLKPVITSFTPSSGPIGTIVTISGSNFSTTTSNNIVKFGNVQATVSITTDTLLTIAVPVGAASQTISVTVKGQTANSSVPFYVILPPFINSFSPSSGPVGTIVTIAGSNFDIVSSNNIVKFGAVQATVSSASGTILTVTVPPGATNQPIYVTVNELTANSNASFAVIIPPAITSFNPTSGPVGTTVNIAGSDFSANISENIVRFGTVQAAVISATATQLTVIVPTGATTQPIYVNVNGLTANTSTSFNVVIPPVITSFNPASGPIGTSVIISGSNFSTTASNNIVWFGAVQATVTGASNTILTVTVPIGATTQPITVTVNGLTTISGTSFTVTAPPSDPPVISSFNPTSGPVGTTVTITGANFNINISSNSVRFGIVQAAVISASPTQLTVIVPGGATTQPIYVNVNGLTTNTSTSFNVTIPPVIASFNPASGPVGTTVTIQGNNFNPIPANNMVLFGTAQASVISATATQLSVIVPAGAITQPITVTANGLTAISGTYFMVITNNPPVINSFTPASGPVGATVTITGMNFSTNASDNIVAFGNVQATITTATSTELTVTVPTGAISSPIKITVNGQSVTTNNQFTITTPGDVHINGSIPLESSVITLNGDGINDLLVIKNFESYGKCNIYIYNVRGALIYSKKDYMNDWDMKINGRMLETGGYFYVIETESGVFRGSFSILR